MYMILLGCHVKIVKYAKNKIKGCDGYGLSATKRIVEQLNIFLFLNFILFKNFN